MPIKQTHAIPRCGGLCKDGSKCTQYPIRNGNGRCRMHNGHAKRGIEASRYVDGKYSKYLPYPFAGAYKEAQSDEQLLSVRQEIALSDAMIMSLLPALETGESADAWKSLKNIMPGLRRAYTEVDRAGMAYSINLIDALLDKQMQYYAAYDAVNKQADHRRKLVETETKISLQGESAIPITLFAMLIDAIFEAIEMGVASKDERIAVATQVRQLISAGN